MKTPSMRSRACRGVMALLVAATVTACSDREAEAPPATEATPSATDAPIPATASPYDVLPEAVRIVLDKPFTELVKRRAIRVAVTFNRTHYFIDRGQQRGITYEALKQFEDDLNADLKTGTLKVHVVIVPMPRDQMYPALAGGKVDIVAAMVTVRPELEKLVAFSEPTRTNVSEVVVTGPGAPPIARLDDLAGQEVFVRKGSVYEESLVRLNQDLKARGKPAVVIDEAPAVLEDDDVLEMVNAGLVPITIADDYLAEFWSRSSRESRCTATSPCGPAAAWPWPFGKRIPSCERPSISGSASTPRATPSETPSNVAISTASSTRRTRPPIASVRSFRRWPSCSRSTGPSTTSITC